MFTKTAAATGVTPATLITINCTVTIDNAHKSTHVPETVNVESHVGCDNFVSTIRIDTYLWRAGVKVAGKTVNGSLLPFLHGNASTACSNAPWGGTAHAHVVPPIGYSPPYGDADVSSPSITNITC
jgi:hypothetical protein